MDAAVRIVFLEANSMQIHSAAELQRVDSKARYEAVCFPSDLQPDVPITFCPFEQESL
jgi:hypothetical protein